MPTFDVFDTMQPPNKKRCLEDNARSPSAGEPHSASVDVHVDVDVDVDMDVVNQFAKTTLDSEPTDQKTCLLNFPLALRRCELEQKTSLSIVLTVPTTTSTATTSRSPDYVWPPTLHFSPSQYNPLKFSDPSHHQHSL